MSASVDEVVDLGSHGKGSGESSCSSSSSLLRCCFFNNNMLNSTAISHDEYVVAAANDFIGLLLKLETPSLFTFHFHLFLTDTSFIKLINWCLQNGHHWSSPVLLRFHNICFVQWWRMGWRRRRGR